MHAQAYGGSMVQGLLSDMYLRGSVLGKTACERLLPACEHVFFVPWGCSY